MHQGGLYAKRQTIPQHGRLKMNHKITAQLIKRFGEADFSYSLINGCRKVARAKVVYANGHSYEIIYEKPIDGLEEFTGGESSYMLYPTHVNGGTVIPVPDKLMFVVDKLVSMTEIPKAESEKIKNEMLANIKEYNKQMWG